MATLKRIILIAVLISMTVTGWAISRDSCMNIAASYYYATWTAVAGNCNKTYNTYTVGQVTQGIPYNWGGYDMLTTAKNKLKSGVVAGDSKVFGTAMTSYAGVDCSGYVSRCWISGRYTTSTIPSIATTIAWTALIRGDVTNKASSHVRLVDYLVTGSNNIMLYESTAGVSPPRVTHRVLSRDTTYIPMRYKSMLPVSDWHLYDE
jgi:hypothetical protein